MRKSTIFFWLSVIFSIITLIVFYLPKFVKNIDWITSSSAVIAGFLCFPSILFMVLYHLQPDTKKDIFSFWEFVTEFCKNIGYGLILTGIALLFTDTYRTYLSVPFIIVGCIVVILGLKQEQKKYRLKEQIRNAKQ